MKVVVAIDSLKGSLSSLEAGSAIRAGIFRVYPDANVIVKPLADGGEGTTEALVQGLGGDVIPVSVHGPMRGTVEAIYGFLPEKKLAILEMAMAAGITLVQNDEKNPWDATTYGVGEMILDAIGRGCRDFIIGIGGSATNDAGLGMLTALGFEFKDASGKSVGITPKSLRKIVTVHTENVPPDLKDCKFNVACDVNNPLFGENGATYIYGSQKGVTPEDRAVLDNDIRHFASVTAAATGRDFSAFPGAGAAGGLGFAFLSYLQATLSPGIDLILDAVELEKDLAGADFAVTGEGRLDHQTAMGKAPIGVAKLAKNHGAKVIALAGSVTEDARACNENGLDAYFPILQGVSTLEEAMDKDTAARNMENTAEQVFRLIHAME
ncbi:glycerate kinase [Clostridia bacterium]|nr:glycerate kinase [Clostridia bacterium]